MLFSCILPVYNTERIELEKCINSILKQTFTDYEIILVDDGSIDKIAYICDEYMKKYDKVRVIHQQNMGLAGARNTGIENAHGDWLIHIDSDDWIDRDLLELVAKRIERTDAEILFWGYRACNGSKKKEYLLKNKKIMDYPYEQQKDSFIEAIMMANRDYEHIALNTTWAKAFNRKFVLENNLKFDLDLRRSQDVIYNLYAFDAAHNVEYIDVAASNYRLDNFSLSRGYNDKTFERLKKTANACLKFADMYPDKIDYKMAALSFCRRCFRMIIVQDFMNDNNTQTISVKQKRFKEALSKEPFNTAFTKEAILSNPDKDFLESILIAKGRYNMLALYWKLRSIVRMIKN